MPSLTYALKSGCSIILIKDKRSLQKQKQTETNTKYAQGDIAGVSLKRVINLFQSVEVGIEDHRRFVVAENRGETLFGNRQEAAPIVKAGEFIDERQALQRCFGALALGDVLNLKNEMRRIVLRVAQ